MNPEPSDGLALSIAGLSKSFDGNRGERLEVLENINLDVRRRERIAIIGPSGCGKSTLLRLVAGIEKIGPKDEGQIAIGDLPPGHPDVRTGFVFQSYSTFPWLTAIKNVTLAARRRGLSKADAHEAALQSLESVHLSQFADTFPERLSGGQRQRLAFACALAMDPELLLLDEPMGALDPITREHLQIELLDLWSKTSQTSVLVTHDISEAILLGDRVFVMSARPGRLVLELDAHLEKPWLGKKGMRRENLVTAVNDVRRSTGFLELADRLRSSLSARTGTQHD